MDESFLLMLSNLLQLHNHLDPSSSAVAVTTTDGATSSSVAPLLFFTLASVLSFISSKSPKYPSPSSKPSKCPPSPSKFSVSAFRVHSTERIWQIPVALRDSEWRSLYGLSYPVFTTVVEKLKPCIQASNLSLPCDYAVAMVLSRLCHGFSSQTLATRYGLEPYLVSKITNMVTRLLSTKLYPEFVKIPVGRKRLHETVQGFEDFTGLPNVCGAIDGSPIRIRKMKISGDLDDRVDCNLKCRHGFDSVLLQVVADHKKIFWDVCVKAPGGSDDSSHLRESLLYNRLISEDIVWDKVINVRGHHLRPYIVGDWCYPLLSFLLTPFSSSNGDTESHALFNEALMKGRSVVVEAIGLLKARWKILQELNVGLNHAPQTIVACCVLHNLCQIAREPEPELWKEPEESGPPPRLVENEKSFHYYGESMRRAIADDLQHRQSSPR